MMILRKLSFYLALAGVFGVAVLVKRFRTVPPPPPPLAEPSRSPFAHFVAATGIIEAVRENVKVATPRAALVERVLVEVGSRVKAGDPLFQLDSRESKARLATAEAELLSLRAALRAERILAADAADQFQRVERLRRDQVASEDERTRKEFALRNWEARVAKLEADILAAEAVVNQARVELEVLTVRAPREGTVLQVNIREGEQAAVNPVEPLLILGETDRLQVRADVDEQNAPLVRPGEAAVAYLKGDTQSPIPLRFVRIEPYVVPKRSLTGDSAERVDTRVLQIIFQLDRPATPLYVGQQVDVFISRPAGSPGAP